MSITVDIEKLLSELDNVQLTPRRNFPVIGTGSLFYILEDCSVCLVSNSWRSDTKIDEVFGMLDSELDDARENKILEGITGLLVACAIRKGDNLKFFNSTEWQNNLFCAFYEYRTLHNFPTEELMLREVSFDLYKEDLGSILSSTVLSRIDYIKKQFYFYCINRELKSCGYITKDGLIDWRMLMWRQISSEIEISVEDNKKIKFINPNVEFIPKLIFGSDKKKHFCIGFIACLVNLDYYYVLINRRLKVKDFNLCRWDRLVAILYNLNMESDPSVVVFSNDVSTKEFFGDFGLDTDELFECYLSELKGKIAESLKAQPKRISRSKLDDDSLNSQIYNWEKDWLDKMVNSELRTAFDHDTWARYVNYANSFLEYLREVHHVKPEKEVTKVVETPSKPVVAEKKIELPSPTDPSTLSDEQKLRLAFMRAIRDTHTKYYSGSTFYIKTAQDWYIVELLAVDLGIISDRKKNKEIMLLLNDVEQEFHIKLTNKPMTSANLSLKKNDIKHAKKFPNWEQGTCDTKDFNRYIAYGKLLFEQVQLQCIELQLTPPTL